jgi:hypothetical protein
MAKNHSNIGPFGNRTEIELYKTGQSGFRMLTVHVFTTVSA